MKAKRAACRRAINHRVGLFKKEGRKTPSKGHIAAAIETCTKNFSSERINCLRSSKTLAKLCG